jgi:O-methyltransferase involved in polyketide biosynthesis
VPVDFEAGRSWWERLATAGFDAGQPAVVVSTGVTVYLSGNATAATLRHIAALATGSTLATTFMLPLELVESEERPLRRATEKFARAAGTPSSASLPGGRTDGLRPSSSEELLVATT